MRTSRFINLSSYCVVEYMFEALNSPNIYSENFILFKNQYLDIHQIVNDDSSYNVTHNIKDLTAVPINDNTYVYLDSEKIPDYLAYDTKITQTSLTGYAVQMDKVRFHFVAGFDFNDFKALILSIKHTENDGKNNLFANILLAPETSDKLIIFNPKPLFLSNAIYDRYVDILVPSIKNINEEYKTAPVQSSTFVAAITPNDSASTGFIYNNQIAIGLAECGKRKSLYTTVGQTYDSFEVTNYVEASVSQSNEFDSVGAYINESTAGDFIEFYLTYDSGFPEDMIAILNRRNPADDWIIIHQISVFEQIGSAFINTSRFVFFQEDNYDEPNIYRPVLKNANEAVSMSIDYLVRLTNRRNGEQIIREASFSLISPKKYGKQLLNIPLLDKPQSQKIYNKIIKKNFDTTKLFIEPELNAVPSDSSSTVTTVTRTEYVPIFFNNNNISVSNSSSLIKTKDSSEEVVFGPGKLRFVLSPFDNIIKLNVYTSSTSSNSVTLIPLDLNINSAKYRLVFETNSGNVSIDHANDANLENLSTGTISFTVSKQQSSSILKSTIKTVYLVSVSQNGNETLMYSGEWRNSTEQSDVDSAIVDAKSSSSASASIQSTLDQINSNIAATDIKQTTESIKSTRSVKSVAVSPVVNKFGIATPSTISPNSNNAGTDQ
jgi:hypothetical protein